jgi:hypothetical protein
MLEEFRVSVLVVSYWNGERAFLKVPLLLGHISTVQRLMIHLN